MSNPFEFSVADLRHASTPQHRRHVGPAPNRIGPTMIGIAQGAPVTVDATLTPLGAGLLIDADITATLSGECVRCLRPLTPEHTLHISQTYALDASFIGGEDPAADDDGDTVPLVTSDTVSIEQAVVDEAGLMLPFNPMCDPTCPDEDSRDVPAPDGELDEAGNIIGGPDPRIDPRWAGLEKFL